MAAIKTKKSSPTLEDKLICPKCNKAQVPSVFYINENELFQPIEKFLICKKCIQEYIGKPDSTDHITRVHRVLAALDKPFDIDEWVKSEELWSKYIPKISSLPQYKGKTYSDSIFNKHISPSTNGEDEEYITSVDFDHNAAIRFWGKGNNYTLEDYDYLQNEYEKLVNAYESDDSYAMQMLFQEASHQRLTIKKLREAGKPVDKELKTLQDLLGSANVKPVQETGANSVEQATFGTLIKKYENERPIPEPDESWKDVDGIKKYIQVWFLGHLCKMLGINNDYAKMYEEELAKHTVDTPVYDEDKEDGDV